LGVTWALLDDVDDLVAFGINDRELCALAEEQVPLHLRDFFSDPRRHRVKLDILWHRIAGC
jgi:hypothetical protein